AFAIVSGPTGLFEISDTGELSVQQESALDFETASFYSLTVEVGDGDASVTAEVTVNVTDVPSPTLAPQTFSVFESLESEGLVGTVVATDTSGETLVFAIALDPDTLFTIESDGALRLRSDARFDVSTAVRHTVEVEVSNGVESATATITVDVSATPVLTIDVAMIEVSTDEHPDSNFFQIADLTAFITAANLPSGVVYELLDPSRESALAVSGSGELLGEEAGLFDFEVLSFSGESTITATLRVRAALGGGEEIADQAPLIVTVEDVPGDDVWYPVGISEAEGGSAGGSGGADVEPDNLDRVNSDFVISDDGTFYTGTSTRVSATTNTTDQYFVRRFDGTSWLRLGDSIVGDAELAGSVGLSTLDNVPYAAYRRVNAPNSSDNGLVALRYDDTDGWSEVGGIISTVSLTSYTAVAFSADGADAVIAGNRQERFDVAGFFNNYVYWYDSANDTWEFLSGEKVFAEDFRETIGGPRRSVRFLGFVPGTRTVVMVTDSFEVARYDLAQGATGSWVIDAIDRDANIGASEFPRAVDMDSTGALFAVYVRSNPTDVFLAELVGTTWTRRISVPVARSANNSAWDLEFNREDEPFVALTNNGSPRLLHVYRGNVGADSWTQVGRTVQSNAGFPVVLRMDGERPVVLFSGGGQRAIESVDASALLPD
ncbi:MAG: hypothetical protein AAFX94_08055, partial [Myxococcota bacterium]